MRLNFFPFKNYKLSRIAYTGLSALICLGCGRSTPSEVSGNETQKLSPVDPIQPSNFRVALIMSGPKSDNGWNADAANALETIRKELQLSDLTVKSVESQTSPSQQEKSLQDFAAKKFNVIIGHGTEYQKPALQIEKDFPESQFVISAGDTVGKNTTPIVLRLEDGAYLEGMIAAGVSKTNKLASVGATQDPSLAHVFTAFEKGAKAIKPNIQVIPPVYTNDWDDAGKAKRATSALLYQGADVIIQDVDSAAQGVFSAVQDFNKGGKLAYALGTNRDQNEVAPDVVLASAPIYIEKAFVPIVKSIKAGTWKPTNKPFGMKEGVIGFVMNPKLASVVPAAIKRKVEAAQKQIEAGELDVMK